MLGLTAALVSMLLNGYFVIPYLIPKFQAKRQSNSQTRLMSANMMYGHRSPEKFLSKIYKIDPDILVLQEMSASNQEKVADLWDKFPFASDRPNGGSREILVFSKIPIDSVEHIVGDKPWRAQAKVNMMIDDQPITILGIHPKAPMSPGRFARRNNELEKIAAHVSQVDTPIIVAGDMNITPWTPIFRKFLRDAELNDGRRGFGFNFTWAHSNLPKSIPIDHVLYRDLAIHSFKSGPNTGSDHLPVIVEFSVALFGK